MPSAGEFARGSMSSFDSAVEVGVRFAGRELKHARQTRLSPGGVGVGCERAATCRYGGIGVVIAMTKCAGLANKGTSISPARRLACKSTDVINAFRRTRRSRVRCSGSPSTKQLCSEPRFCRGTNSGSSDITHLHENDASECIENLRRRTLLVSAGNRRRARRDLRLRASSLPWTPAPKTSSQFPVYGKASPGCKDFPEHGLVTLCPRFIYA